jgi:DNA-binding response OmpR family regulator
MHSHTSGLPGKLVAVVVDLVTPGSIELEGEVCTLGRAAGCSIVVQHPLVSRLHARIERSGPRYVLADAGSANGTYVNSQRLRGLHVLGDNDLIGLGTARPLLRFVDPDPTTRAEGQLRFDERTMSFWYGEQPVSLTPMQFRLLHYLYQHAGEVCSRESCAQAIWGRDYDPGMDAGALDTALNSLRKALRAVSLGADLIETRRGLGYVLHY